MMPLCKAVSATTVLTAAASSLLDIADTGTLRPIALCGVTYTDRERRGHRLLTDACGKITGAK